MQNMLQMTPWPDWSDETSSQEDWRKSISSANSKLNIPLCLDMDKEYQNKKWTSGKVENSAINTGPM